MPRFFIGKEQIDRTTVTVTGEDAHHISRALRMAAGEHITVCDPDGTEYDCELTAFLPDCVRAEIRSSRRSEAEPPYRACLYQALPKGDKLDSVIQKAVECGVAEITTFESARCITRAKEENEEKKLSRRRRIATEAAKQCGRAAIPDVNPTVSFGKMLELAKRADLALFCYEEESGVTLRDALTAAKAKFPADRVPNVAIVVGSEGGFSKEEAEAAKQAGILSVGLGKRILRTETAASFVLSCLVYELEFPFPCAFSPN